MSAKFWNDERDAKLRELWPQRHIKLSAMPELLGGQISSPSISLRAKVLGLQARCAIAQLARFICNEHLNKEDVNMARPSGYLEREAKRRNIGVPELIRRIMSTVTHDRMVNAILDDDVPEVAAPDVAMTTERA